MSAPPDCAEGFSAHPFVAVGTTGEPLEVCEHDDPASAAQHSLPDTGTPVTPDVRRLLLAHERSLRLQHQCEIERLQIEHSQTLSATMVSLQEKERIITEQRRALTAYRLALHPLGKILPALRTSLTKGAGRLHRLHQRYREIIRPRLGNLRQYAPRELRVPASRPFNLPQAAPTISVVTPSYGQGDYIEATLLSVLDQDYPALEYFVQDGGSTDGTVAVLRSHQHRLSGWASAADEGQAQAINLGFSRSTGEIMAWLNSDDLLLPGTLACVAEFFVRHPEVDVVYGNRLLIDEEGREIGRWILPDHDGEVLQWADYVPQETLFWRRRIWERAGGCVDESFRFAMDWDLLLRFMAVGAKFAHLPRFLGAFRIHTRQKTSTVIHDLGLSEMSRIRERIWGHVPHHTEIHRAITPFMRRHLLADMRYRIATRLLRQAVATGGDQP